jgi:hypothetical protein
MGQRVVNGYDKYVGIVTALIRSVRRRESIEPTFLRIVCLAVRRLPAGQDLQRH